MEIRFIDMFCGIGGFRLGLEKANQESGECESWQEGAIGRGGRPIRNIPSVASGGAESEQKQGYRIRSQRQDFRCVWSNDNDRYACQIYRKHWGEVCEGDIRTVDASTIPEHDLLCAGFPCQSFSIAGGRGGFADTRGTLFQEICRVAGTKRPSYLLLENVKGLLSVPYTEAIQEWAEEDFDTETGEPTARASKKHRAIPNTKGWVLLTILHNLWELGYDCQGQVLNSKDYGVPQNRERVFIVGHFRGKPRPKVFPIGETGSASTEGNDTRGKVSPAGQDLQSRKRHTKLTSRDTRFNTSLDEDKNLELKYVGAIMSEQNQKWLEDGKELSRNFPQGQRVYSVEGIASSICGDAGGLGGKTGLYMNALTEAFGTRQGSSKEFIGSVEKISQSIGQIRRLTPTECERLQGFPDGWTEGISDTQRYKCLGNAVTVNVIEAIGSQFLEGLETGG